MNLSRQNVVTAGSLILLREHGRYDVYSLSVTFGDRASDEK